MALHPHWFGRPHVVQAPGDRHDGTVAHALRARTPGMVWTPDGAVGPLPVVLLGHGGAGHKADPVTQDLARAYCTGVGAAVVVIDGPAHGDREPPGDTPDERRRRRVLEQARIFADADAVSVFVGEWRDALAAVRRDYGATGPAGYAGFSMGTILGVPTVAAIADVRCAVFGIGGATTAESRAAHFASHGVEAPPHRDGRVSITEAARRIDRDVLMLNMTRDEVIPVDGALRLFEAFAGPKRIALWEGGHIELPSEALDMSVSFLRERLCT